ncbi:MAG: glutaredoxin-related UxxT selenoprotein, partial [Desulfobacterales bacterium]
TRAAREAYAKEKRQVEYRNVVTEPDHLENMLMYSKGVRKVPVIVEGQNVTIGFDGGT